MPDSATTTEGEEIFVGDVVRVVNWAGPCITHTVVSIGSARFRFEDDSYSHIRYGGTHKKPCNRCVDHPNTFYPRGYDN